MAPHNSSLVSSTLIGCSAPISLTTTLDAASVLRIGHEHRSIWPAVSVDLARGSHEI